VATLKEENRKLQNSISLSMHECTHAKAEISNIKKELVNAKAEALKATGMPPMIKKETEKVSMLRMLGDAILFILNVVMFRTQPITRLRSLCEIIFDNELLGTFATETVLHEVSLKYARKKIFFSLASSAKH
jgi:hypothetical protein